ncbi:MAG: propionate catabolism operon regulatory protein PrpR, partial [Betaproteobacteria bacterium]|nr:propionate catabolism operon regulatory protein PrpR [Betaproteobacteria bacterium]
MPTVDAALESPPRILAVGFLRLKQLLQEVAPEYEQRARVDVVDRGFDDALAEIEARRAAEGVDVLVSAGLHGAFLRSRSELPVVTVKVGGFDLMLALARARALSRRVALVSFGAPSGEVEQFSREFSLDIVQRSYRSEADAAACVRELREAGVEVVVAPGMVLDLAEQQGMRGILLYSHDAVRAAIDDAVEVARAARIAAAKRERLNTILEQLRDGVVAVDESERIEAINPPMLRLLGRTRQQLLGRVLGDVAPEFTLARTLRDGVEHAEDIVRYGAQTLVLSRTPLVERGVRTGAVLTCQDPATIQRVDRNLRARERAAPTITRWRLDDLVGASGAMQRAREQALRFARSEATVLIAGESGTGKELFAQGLHAASRRRAQPFVAINCAAFPESLLESELFGYEEGAFTGARKSGKPGLFEAAHTGTVFLDEIGDMPLALQTRLLRVLQEREILRVGATEPTPVDVRVIAATHRDLAARIDAGLFRRDLYYRLNILRLELPSLRE